MAAAHRRIILLSCRLRMSCPPSPPPLRRLPTLLTAAATVDGEEADAFSEVPRSVRADPTTLPTIGTPPSPASFVSALSSSSSSSSSDAVLGIKTNPNKSVRIIVLEGAAAAAAGDDDRADPFGPSSAHFSQRNPTEDDEEKGQKGEVSSPSAMGCDDSRPPPRPPNNHRRTRATSDITEAVASATPTAASFKRCTASSPITSLFSSPFVFSCGPSAARRSLA